MILQFQKGDIVRHLGLLDLQRTMQRALRRSGLPIAYSKGFSPHIVMSFASALSSGIPGDAELLDVGLDGETTEAECLAAMNHVLPPALAVSRVRLVDDRYPKLGAALRQAQYRITLRGAGAKAGAQTLYEVLLGTATAEKCIVSTDTPGMDVLPGDIRLAACEVEMVQLERREYRLRAALRPLLDRYDYILIDCPPSLGLLTINALTAANSVLIPIQCEYYALEGVTSLMDTVARIKRGLNASLDIEGVLLTMLDGRTNLGLQVVAQVKKHFRGKVFATIVPRNVRLGEAPSHALPINRYDPRSTGAEAYRALAREVMARNGDKPAR